MVVEDVHFKRVIIKRVPIDKVKNVSSMPQSVEKYCNDKKNVAKDNCKLNRDD